MESRFTDPHRRELRVEIAQRVLRQSDVRGDEVDHILRHDAVAADPDAGELHSLLINLRRVGRQGPGDLPAYLAPVRHRDPRRHLGLLLLTGSPILN